MNILSKHDMYWAVKRLPKNLRKIMGDPEWVGKIVVAGGYLRSIITGEKPNDIDLFVSSLKEAELLAYKLADTKDCVKKTDNAYTIVNKGELVIQIIHRWLFSTPEQVIESFDFTCCGAAVFTKLFVPVSAMAKGDEKVVWSSLVLEDFYPSIAAKRLIYTCPKRNEDAGGSILRVLKYYQRGYRIPVDSLGDVIARLVQAVDFDLMKKSGGISEPQTAKIITGLLREVDPNIDPFHNSHLPSFFETDLRKIEPAGDENTDISTQVPGG